MFKDMDLSKNMFPDFAKNIHNNVDGIEFTNISILTTGTWPFKESDIPKFEIPKQMKDLVFKFERFYK
jgi:hypothetical protein